MAIIFVRSTIIYIVLLIIMRLMGKRQIGEMQPYEFIVAILISELACIPMTDVSVPLLYGVVAIVAVFIMHQSISIVQQTSQTAKRIFIFPLFPIRFWRSTTRGRLCSGRWAKAV